MEHNKKKPYEAPALTAVTIRPERGYASSGVDLVDQFPLFNISGGDEEPMEQYNSYNDWGGGSFFG